MFNIWKKLLDTNLIWIELRLRIIDLLVNFISHLKNNVISGIV
jgi:hypothetical protein